MRRRIGGFQRWKSLLGRIEIPWQRQAHHESARRRRGDGESAAALAEAIEAHERLVGDLVSVTDAQRAVLQELCQSAGLDERMEALPIAATASGGAATAPSTAPRTSKHGCSDPLR